MKTASSILSVIARAPAIEKHDRFSTRDHWFYIKRAEDAAALGAHTPGLAPTFAKDGKITVQVLDSVYDDLRTTNFVVDDIDFSRHLGDFIPVHFTTGSFGYEMIEDLSNDMKMNSRILHKDDLIRLSLVQGSCSYHGCPFCKDEGKILSKSIVPAIKTAAWLQSQMPLIKKQLIDMLKFHSSDRAPRSNYLSSKCAEVLQKLGV
jgi:hypothetical protein